MSRLSGQRILRYLVAVLTILGFVTTAIALTEGRAPIALGTLTFAFGAGAWLIRGDWSGGHLPLPDPWKTTAVISLALAVGFAVAWHERRPGTQTQFEFVVVPSSGEFVLESVAPEPQTEIFPGLQFRYGARVWVTCFTPGAKNRRWFRLVDHRFLPSKDLRPAPLTGGSPPECQMPELPAG